MAQLIVRGLDQRIVEQLELRAAEHGRSVEDEHRRILEEVLASSPRRGLKQHLPDIPSVGDDDDFLRPDDRGRAVVL